MLALMGAFNMVEGLVVMYDRHAIRVDPARILLLNLAGWARVTLMLGALLLALGLWLSVVTLRVRPVALSVVCVHALSQLGVLAALPAWALLMIAFDVVIIFALTATPAGVAATAARGGVDPVGARTGRPAPAGRAGTAQRPTGTAQRLTGGTGRTGGGRAGYHPPADRIGYRPRHQVAAADTTLVLGPPLTDDGPPVGDTTPPALPCPPPPAILDSRPRPAAATIVGTLARTADAARPGAAASGDSAADAAGAPTTAAPERPAPPIIGAISGRWPDVNRK